MDVGSIVDEELARFAEKLREDAAAVSARIRARIAAEVMGIAPASVATLSRAYRPPAPGRMTKRAVEEARDAALRLFRPGLQLAAGDVAGPLGLSRHRVERVLTSLVKARKLRRSGKARWTRYAIA